MLTIRWQDSAATGQLELRFSIWSSSVEDFCHKPTASTLSAIPLLVNGGRGCSCLFIETSDASGLCKQSFLPTDDS